MQKENKKSQKKYWLPVILILAGVALVVLVVIGVAFSIYKVSDISRGVGEDAYYPSPAADLGYTEDLISYDASAEAVTEETAEESAVGEADLGTTTKIIKTGALSLTVTSTSEAVTKITQLTEQAGGFIQNSYTYTTSDDRLAGEVTARVPVAQFNALVEQIKQEAEVVVSEDISGEDVTEDYIDLDSRLTNLRAQENQYTEILKQAQSVEDILKVTKQLDAVRQEIEVIQGRLKYLENKTDLATLTIYLSEETELSALSEKWQPLENVRLAFRSWVKALQKLLDILVWMAIFLLPPALIVFLIVKIILRRRRNKKNK